MKPLSGILKDNGHSPELANKSGKRVYDEKLGAKVWASAAELAEKGANNEV